MTIWKAGMLAVCVDRETHDCGAECDCIYDGAKTPPLNSVRRVVRVTQEWDCLAYPFVLHFDDGLCGWAERFRPLIDEPDNAEIIAQIKAAKPARIPHLEPLTGHISHDLPSGVEALGLHLTGAGDRADDPTRRPCSPTQSINDAVNQSANLNSFFHVAQFTQSEGHDHG